MSKNKLQVFLLSLIVILSFLVFSRVFNTVGISNQYITNLSDTSVTYLATTAKNSELTLLVSEKKVWMPFYVRNDSQFNETLPVDGAKLHGITAENLKPDTDYYLYLLEGNRIVRGSEKKVRTVSIPDNPAIPEPFYGEIEDIEHSRGFIIFQKVSSKNASKSQYISVPLVSVTYSADFANLLTEDMKTQFNKSKDDTVSVIVLAENSATDEDVVIYTSEVSIGKNPQQKITFDTAE